jgi:RHS repeat-associated protein
LLTFGLLQSGVHCSDPETSFASENLYGRPQGSNNSDVRFLVMGKLGSAKMKRWLFVCIAMVSLAGAAAAAGTYYNVICSWFNPYHTGDPVGPNGQGFYTCYFTLSLDGASQGISTNNGYGSQVWYTQISATAGQAFSIQGQVMDSSMDLCGGIAVTATVIPAVAPPAAQNQDPQVHPVQRSASVAEPVDAATGYLWYSQTLLKEEGAQALDYAIYGKFGGLAGADFGSTYDVSIQVYGATIPGVSSVTLSQNLPSVTFSQKGRGIHHYYEHTDGNYYSPELGAQYEWIQPVGSTQYILHRPDQSQLVFSMNSASGSQTVLSGYLSTIVNSHGQKIQVARSATSPGQITSVTEPVSGAGFTYQYDQSGNLSAVTDNLGRQVVYSYGSTAGVPAQVQVISQAGTVVNSLSFTYDSNGNLTALVDQDGRMIMQNSYDTQGRVVSQQDGRGATTQFNYQLNNDGTRATTVTDRNGKNTVYSFAANLLLLKKVNPTGAFEQWTYDSNGNTLSYTNQNGNTTSYTYDTNGNVLSITDPTYQVTTMTYDTLNRLTTVTDPARQVTSYAYDKNNNVVQLTDPLKNVTALVWDANSLLSSRTMPRGGKETYAYTNGLLTGKTDANSNVWNFAYDEAGRLISTQDPTGALSSCTYDALDHLTAATDPLNHTRVFSYNSRGWKLSETDPSGNTTTLQYDNNGNLINRIDPAPGGTTTYQYDPEDRLIGVTDPLNHSITYGRDAAGRVISVTDGRGKTQSLQLDGVGHTIQAFDAHSNRIAQNYYDTRELLEKSTDAVGRMQNWNFDARGALINSTDGLGNATRFAYDALNRLSQVTSSLSNLTAHGYDQDGNRNSLTNGQANTTTFSFDLGDRLSSVTTASSLATLYSYNSRNLVATITKPSSQQTTNTYDAASRLVQLADPFATTAYSYDNSGRLTETDDNAYGQSRKTVRVYDPLGRLISYTDEAGNTIGYAYDQAGNLTQLTYPGGKVVSYSYDANNRLSTVTDWASRTTTYSYDDNGRLVQTVYPNNTQENRSYDLSGKLTRIQDLDPSGNVIYGSLEQLDVTGRTVAENVTPVPTSFSIPNATMTFDADNRLSNFNGKSVSFDADGNMTSGPSAITLNAISYNYDARNRLTSAGNVSYNYNPDGRRTSLSDATVNPNGVSSTFVIDPNARLDRLLVRNQGGTATYYVYGLGLIGQEQSGIYQNYHFDSRGSTVAMTDAKGVVTDRFEYDSYGESLSHTGTSDTSFQYNGKYGVQTDANGLLYMRARYYNPAIRRFINQDVLFGDLNPGISLNRFAFANGNPVSLMDPFGLCAQDDDPSWTAEFCQFGGGLLKGLGTLAAFPFTSGLKAISDLQYIVKGQIPPSPTLQDLGNALVSDLSTCRGLGRLASGFIIGEGIGELGAAESAMPAFTQTTASAFFRNGEFAGQSIANVAQGLRSGAISPSQLPLQVISREENVLTL